MIGALIGAGLSAVSSIAGGIAARKEREKARRMMQQQLRENQATYNTQYFSDPTQRGDFKRLLAETDKRLKQRTQAASGTQAMMGGTEDSVASVREGNNEVLANATGNMVAANEARKDAIRNNYESRKAAIQGQIIQDQYNQANDIARTVQGVAQVGGHIANGLDSVQGKAQEDGDVNGLDPISDVAKPSQKVGSGSGGSIADAIRKGGASV